MGTAIDYWAEIFFNRDNHAREWAQASPQERDVYMTEARADWNKRAEASYARAVHLPED